MTANNSGPTKEEKARFLIKHSHESIGVLDTLEEGMKGGFHTGPSDTPEEFLNNLEIELTEGINAAIQNKVELGYDRINAFEIATRGMPEWITVQVARRDLDHYRGADPSFYSDDEQEYIEYLEAITQE